MSVLSAILQHQREQQAVQPATAVPQTTTTGSSGSSAGSSAASTASATISANDFLSLLVTEMQNQDPTANTDPNEYINQLVQVNSLEQLININQTLTTAYPTPATTSTSTAAPKVVTATKPSVPASSAALSAQQTPLKKGTAAIDAASLQPTAGGSFSSLAAARSSNTGQSDPASAKLGAGNLAIPVASPAATRVAQSLGGQPHSQNLHTNSTPDYSGR
jgi:flagellar basal-body rod modification protein FlgD